MSLVEELSNLSKRISSVEKQLSDFTEALNEKQQGDIDFIAMETGVDLDMGNEEEEE